MISEKHKLQLQEVHKKNKKHGMGGSDIYYVWAQILQRCNNKNSKPYRLYGGRGIRVCLSWHKFEAFFNWAMKNGYKKGLSIDRINNDGDYEPSNCRWVNQKHQCNNKRGNRNITYSGQTKTLSEWCEILSLNYDRMYDRLFRQNWSIEKSFETQILPINAKKSQYRKTKLY